MLAFQLHPAADREAIDAAKWIQRDDAKQAALFVDAVEKTINRARSRPDLYRLFEGEFRKARIGKFSYALVFRVRGEVIQILAVMHLHREPGYWKDRVED